MVIQRSHFKLVLLMLLIISCQQQPGVDKEGFSVSESGLKYRVIKEGSVRMARVGQEILLHEKMFYMNDSLLFDSRQLPNPVKVLIGGNQAIKGIDEALVGMRKGELKEIIVPPKLSRRQGDQVFPHPDSTLRYQVNLLEIVTPQR